MSTFYNFNFIFSSKIRCDIYKIFISELQNIKIMNILLFFELQNIKIKKNKIFISELQNIKIIKNEIFNNVYILTIHLG